MINLDDGRKSQLIYAKPILDKYGFKVRFFLICGRVGTEPSWMNWQRRQRNCVNDYDTREKT